MFTSVASERDTRGVKREDVSLMLSRIIGALGSFRRLSRCVGLHRALASQLMCRMSF